MAKILALSGSLRADSYNTALAKATKALAPPEVQVEVATLHGIPLYDGDLEASEGVPGAVLTLKERIIANDGLLLVSPEYNNGIPGVMKNGIDWLSRADLNAIFGSRPTSVIGATPGGWGTLAAQIAWLPVLRTLGTTLFMNHRFMLSHVSNSIDKSGQLVDISARELLVDLLKDFGEFIDNQTKVRGIS